MTFDIGIRESWEDAIRSVEKAGGKPYPIPAGASVHKYGALGYVGFAEEVARQEDDLVRKGAFPEGFGILYVHLGGARAINGYSYYYKDG